MSLSLRWIGHPAAWVVFCAAVLAMAPGYAVAREFRVADNQPADYPSVRALEFMANIVEERTNGRHWIRVFHSSQLGEEEQTLQQTRAGVIDIVRTTVAPMSPTALKAGVAKFVESIGGKLEFWYFDYGEATAYSVIYYPDEIAAATAQLSTNAAGFARVRIRPLLSAEEMDKAAAKVPPVKVPQQQ